MQENVAPSLSVYFFNCNTQRIPEHRCCRCLCRAQKTLEPRSPSVVRRVEHMRQKEKNLPVHYGVLAGIYFVSTYGFCSEPIRLEILTGFRRGVREADWENDSPVPSGRRRALAGKHQRTCMESGKKEKESEDRTRKDNSMLDLAQWTIQLRRPWSCYNTMAYRAIVHPQIVGKAKYSPPALVCI